MEMIICHFSTSSTFSQLFYANAAAEALSTVQGDIEELTVSAEGEYRFVSGLGYDANVTLQTCVGSLATTEVPLG